MDVVNCHLEFGVECYWYKITASPVLLGYRHVHHKSVCWAHAGYVLQMYTTTTTLTDLIQYNTYGGKNPTKHNTSTQHAPVRSTRDNSIYQAVRDRSLANGSSTERKKMPVSQSMHGVQSQWAVITLKDMTLFLTGCCEMCHSLAMRNHFGRTEDCSWIPCTNKETYFWVKKQLAYTQQAAFTVQAKPLRIRFKIILCNTKLLC